MIFPPPLVPGAQIAVVAPASQVNKGSIEKGIEVLEQWGYRIYRGEALYSQHGQFAGADAIRLADLQNVINDPDVSAVIMARGGYGTTRIMDRLDFTALINHPKWIVGFSDITALHAHLQQLGLASIHGSMPGFYHLAEAQASTESLRRLLCGSLDDFHIPPHDLNRPGLADGKVVGGNLAIISHLIGTRSALDTEGKILLLEDVGEYLYNIDRMMVQLRRSGLLANMAGLVVGHFNELKDTKIPFGKDVLEIISEHVSDYDYPVAFGFPVGHTEENFPFVEGAYAELRVEERVCSLRFAKEQILQGDPQV
jgi:muramoyltetrapeptide carboxypeptidase